MSELRAGPFSDANVATVLARYRSIVREVVSASPDLWQLPVIRGTTEPAHHGEYTPRCRGCTTVALRPESTRLGRRAGHLLPRLAGRHAPPWNRLDIAVARSLRLHAGDSPGVEPRGMYGQAHCAPMLASPRPGPAILGVGARSRLTGGERQPRSRSADVSARTPRAARETPASQLATAPRFPRI